MTDLPMSKTYALKIVKKLGDTTILESEKDRAVRTILECKVVPHDIKRDEAVRILEWVYEHYMKEG